MINAIHVAPPIVPDDPPDNGDPDPIDDGSEPPAGDPPDDPVVGSGTSSSGAWVIIPIAIILMIVGIGAYFFIAVRRKGTSG
jgi:hypothetical protein